MPTSVLLVAERAVTFAGTITPTPATVLDVGPGYGKYGVLLREYLDPTPERIDAVEAWAPYITEHRLRGIYDRVWHAQAQQLPEHELAQYELVTMGDVIEHMPKDEALALLDRCPGWVVIATPVEHFHTDEGLPPTEAHVSHWTRADFQGTGRLERYEQSYGAQVVRLAPRA